MAKPISAACNLACSYCYYLEKRHLFEKGAGGRMSREVLAAYIREAVAASGPATEVEFAWQGGEPTLLGLDFFEDVVRLQKELSNGKLIRNALQTNGTRLDDEWGRFLARHGFLVGISVDGPAAIHDAYRPTTAGKPSFAQVVRAVEVLKKYKVPFNTLTCVHRGNQLHPLKIYNFLKKLGSRCMQFIPIVERRGAPDADNLTLRLPDAEEATVAPWAVQPAAFGAFLTAIFDEWVRRDVGRVFVQMHDVGLSAWVGAGAPLCVFQQTCGNAPIVEHDGSVFSCDHYVFPGYRLGNLTETPLRELLDSAFQREFGQNKADRLPAQCRQCAYLFACGGDCPKHRFVATGEENKPLSYLCESYLTFFKHVEPAMQFMANELRHRRPPANVMAWMRARQSGGGAAGQMQPNAACLCGSGKKFKACCGRRG